MNPPLCEHLQPLLDEILSKGIKVGYSGMAWSKNCRTWIYLENTLLDCDAIIKRLNLPKCVTIHTHRGTHDGSEHGLYCEEHQDAIMGLHPDLAVAGFHKVD